MAFDPFADRALDMSGPGVDASAVTPSDSVDLPVVCRALYVGTGGDVKVTTASGSVVTFPAVPAGSVLGVVRVRRVWATGTTAGGIVGVV